MLAELETPAHKLENAKFGQTICLYTAAPGTMNTPEVQKACAVENFLN